MTAIGSHQSWAFMHMRWQMFLASLNEMFADRFRSRPASHVKHRYVTQVPASGLFDMIVKVSNYECDGIIERRLHLEYLEKAASATADAYTYSLQKYQPELYSLGMTEDQFEQIEGLQVVDTLGDGPQQLAAMFSPSTDDQTVKDFSFWLTQLVSDGTIKDLYDEVVLANTEVNNALVTQYPVPQVRPVGVDSRRTTAFPLSFNLHDRCARIKHTPKSVV